MLCIGLSCTKLVSFWGKTVSCCQNLSCWKICSVHGSPQMCSMQAKVQQSTSQGKDAVSAKQGWSASPTHAALRSTDQTLRQGFRARGSHCTSSGIAWRSVPPSLALPWGRPYVPHTLQASALAAGRSARPRSAGAKMPVQVSTPITCLPLAFASKPELPEVPKHMLKSEQIWRYA